MNPYFLLACLLGQILWLSISSPSLTGLAWSLAAAALFTILAFTKDRWGAHLDMYLIMAGPGALAMMAPGWISQAPCTIHTAPLHVVAMGVAMLAVSTPLTWRHARCVLRARALGFGGWLMALDAVGMVTGMYAVHVLAQLWPASAGAMLMASAEGPWLMHGLMLAGMAVGMSTAYVSLEWRNAV